MNQPEALRLADWLEDQYDPTHNQEQAAAELRRLYALLEAEQTLHQRATYPELRRLAKVEAQRDALLEALKLARSIIGHPDDAHTQMIDAAIAKAEEQT